MEEALIKKIPPHSTEAEKSVIGSMLMSRDAVIAAAEILNKEDQSIAVDEDHMIQINIH